MIDRTAAELLDRLQQGDVTAQALTEQFLDAIRRMEPQLRSFLLVDEQGARAKAEEVDQRRRRGEALGALAGLPVAIKDVLCIRGQRTTCASKILANFVPPYDAHVIKRLHQADAVLIGKTNCDEFAMGSSTENSAYQVTRNPWNLERVPGGSSGGSAAAVAGCEAPLSLGTDTGGSIRQPASLCGIVGLKPSYGRVSRFGLVAYGSSLDQIGPFAHTVGDAALLLKVIAGYDRRDSTSVDKPVPPYTQTIDTPVPSLTIGVPQEYFTDALDPEVAAGVRAALDVFRTLGARLEEVNLPNSPVALATYYLVATAEASSNLARYDGVHYGHRSKDHTDLISMYKRSRGEGFGAEVKRRIMLGTYALSSGYQEAYYRKALQVRRLIRADFDRAFAGCDVVMGPTSPTPAFKVGERSNDPLRMYLADIYTVTCNLAGLPGISIPCGFTKAGLPIGMQIIGPAFEEEKLLRIARMHERETDWHTRRPALVSSVPALP
jgi:aspartyl-tRNA(Asn)/glutamyl-tRNA(Gln) amidotransferase subunit A